MFVEAHVQFYILYSLPIPNFESNSELCERIINIASRLSSMNILDKEYLKSKDCKLLDEHEKNSLIYELDALVAHLYKLEEKDIIYIFKNFHIGLNYEDRLENVLRFFHSRNVL